jgi:hypothetical protein
VTFNFPNVISAASLLKQIWHLPADGGSFRVSGIGWFSRQDGMKEIMQLREQNRKVSN